VSAGIRLIDKPVGFTSFQIVNIFKRHYRKVGHAGTLDPFASGLLIVLIGSATKDFLSYQKCNKEYIGEMVLGMVTDSYDIAGQILKERWNGNRVQPKKRKVMIVSFTITAVEYPILHFHALVGTGVYVRSLVFEYGNRLGCGATLISLRRTKIGDDSVRTAQKIGEI
jgi:tRNA pseudouridine55 synthase